MITTEATEQVRQPIDAKSVPRAATSLVPPKIQACHQDRLAVVYVRQSSPQQVLEHRESTALQYNLRRRAIQWGWPRDRVLVIDEDQGHSGSTAAGRIGFQRWLAEVSLDHGNNRKTPYKVDGRQSSTHTWERSRGESINTCW